jgi:hypothetical protein
VLFLLPPKFIKGFLSANSLALASELGSNHGFSPVTGSALLELQEYNENINNEVIRAFLKKLYI